jgi:hypothetical protein
LKNFQVAFAVRQSATATSTKLAPDQSAGQRKPHPQLCLHNKIGWISEVKNSQTDRGKTLVSYDMADEHLNLENYLRVNDSTVSIVTSIE